MGIRRCRSLCSPPDVPPPRSKALESARCPCQRPPACCPAVIGPSRIFPSPLHKLQSPPPNISLIASNFVFRSRTSSPHSCPQIITSFTDSRDHQYPHASTTSVGDSTSIPERRRQPYAKRTGRHRRRAGRSGAGEHLESPQRNLLTDMIEANTFNNVRHSAVGCSPRQRRPDLLAHV